MDQKPLVNGYKCTLYKNIVATDCTVERLLDKTDIATMQKKEEPQFVENNAQATVKISVARSLSLSVHVCSSGCPLDLFVLRDEGSTIAIGRITRMLGE